MAPDQTWQLLPRQVSPSPSSAPSSASSSLPSSGPNCDNYACYKFPVYQIVVIALAAVIFLVVFFTALCCFLRCSRRKRKERERAVNGNPDPMDGGFDMEEYVNKQLHAGSNTSATSGRYQQPNQHQFQQHTNNVYPQQQQQNYYAPPPAPSYQPPYQTQPIR